MAEALSALPVPALTLQVNNRKLIEGFFRGIGAGDPGAVMRVDRQDGQGAGRGHREHAGRRRRPGRPAGRAVPGAGRHPLAGHLLRGTGARARGQRPAAGRGAGRAGGGGRGLLGAVQRTVPGRGRPADRPRPGLLHRHGLRDPAGRLREPRLDLLRRSLRLAGQRRPDQLPGGRHLLRGDPDAGPAVRAQEAHREQVGALGRAGRAAGRGRPGRTATRSRSSCGPAACRARSRPARRSTASRSGSPTGGASRSSGSPAPASGHGRATATGQCATSAPASRPPADPDSWLPPAEDLRPRSSVRKPDRLVRSAASVPMGQSVPLPASDVLNPKGNPVLRTHEAGTLRASDAGQPVVLAGWVASRRDHGGVAFIDLRDASGVVQVVVRDDDESRHDLRNEWCIQVTGEVRRRLEGKVNPNSPTGEVEVVADQLEVLNEAAPLPFQIDEHTEVGEEARLKYRYLDLRRPGPAAALRLRSEVNRAAREVLYGARLRRDRDADADPVHARGRPRLPGAGPAAARLLVRAAAVAAAVQAAADGGRHGALLPDRPLLPRRGLPRRPAAGVHPARHRDELRRAGRRDRGRRGGAARAVAR